MNKQAKINELTAKITELEAQIARVRKVIQNRCYESFHKEIPLDSDGIRFMATLCDECEILIRALEGEGK